MNNLEFIDAEIIMWQERLDNLKKELIRVKGTRNEETILNHIEANELHLQYLNQIKAELKAWKETKKYIILKEGRVPLYDSIFEYIELENGCIDESNSEEEGISIMVIKKALEVKK